MKTWHNILVPNILASAEIFKSVIKDFQAWMETNYTELSAGIEPETFRLREACSAVGLQLLAQQVT